MLQIIQQKARQILGSKTYNEANLTAELGMKQIILPLPTQTQNLWANWVRIASFFTHMWQGGMGLSSTCLTSLGWY